MKTVVLDIETIADEAAMERAGYVQEEGEFAPWPLHQLACASVLTVTSRAYDALAFDLRSFSRGKMSEGGIIASVEQAIAEAQQIITYNGKAFDLPVLTTRAIIHEVHAPTLARLSDRCRPGLHLDLHERVKGTAAGVKLAHLCAAFSIPAKTGGNGQDAKALAAAGEWSDIEHYCESDVIATWLATQMWDTRDLPGHGRSRWRELDRWLAQSQSCNPRLSLYRSP